MLPELFCEKLKGLLGEEYDAFLAAMDRPRAVGLRLNPLKLRHSGESEGPLPQSGEARPIEALTDSGLFQALRSMFHLSPVPWCPTGFYYDPQSRPGLHPWHAAGAYYLQEASAMAPVELLDPRPGERVLDLCAAPGGKSTQIAGKMQGRGLLVCNEIHPKRAGILSSNLERLGVSNALVLNEHPGKLAERFPAYFDRILVDAPCSGEGMFRKHDAAFQDWSPETVDMCARRQGEILDCAAAMLRPGGRLVYSTCTFSPEENEGGIAIFLKRHPEFDTEAVSGEHFSPGRPDWADGNPALTKTLRLWPHKLMGEGHFAAVLRKNAQAGSAWGLPQDPRASRSRHSEGREESDSLPPALKKLLSELEITLPQGKPLRFGDRVFWAPPELPELRGLKVLRPGLELAELRRELAIPAHALALWAGEAASLHELAGEDPACAAYLRGETLTTVCSGWTLVRVDGLSLGWGKGVKGVLKNHYPKGLRISTLQADTVVL